MGDESPVRTFKEIDRVTLDEITTRFFQSILEFKDAVEGVSLDEMAGVVEHVGRRLRDDCCANNLRGHAILANQILTIATTRMA